MGIEFELKYKATPEILAAVAAAVEGERAYFEMRTTYYDTVHRLLSGRHWTLRRRIENGRSICTFKTPAGNGARREYEVECDDIMEAVSALCKLSRERVLAGFASTEPPSPSNWKALWQRSPWIRGCCWAAARSCPCASWR